MRWAPTSNATPNNTATAPMTQQEKMTACNAKAGDKKGDQRKAFMSTCLKGGTSTASAPAATPAPTAAPAPAPAPAVAAAPKTQQEKMKACNTAAANKKGDERKAFMSTCLKGEGASATH